METSRDSFERSRTENRHTAEWVDGWTLSVVCSPARGTSPRHFRLTDPLIRLDRKSQPGGMTIRVDDKAITRGAISLRLNQGAYELEDAGSRNPVRVNGAVVRHATLGPNDVVRIGNSLLVLDRDDATRGAWRGHDLITNRVEDLASRLLLFDATMSSQCRFDAGLIEPLYRCVAVWSPGPLASRTVAGWVAEESESEIFTIDAGEEGAVARIEQAPTDVVLVLDGLDERLARHGTALHHAIESRLSMPDSGRILLMAPWGLHDDRPSALEQLLALFADFEMTVPSLSQRRTDLIRALLTLLGTPDEAVSADFAEHILCYSWPGELAELKRTANRLRTFLRREGRLKPTQLPPTMRKQFVQQSSPTTPALTFKMVADAFVEHEGNMSEVARVFGYSRTYFYRLLKQCDISTKELRRQLRRARMEASDT